MPLVCQQLYEIIIGHCLCVGNFVRYLYIHSTHCQYTHYTLAAQGGDMAQTVQLLTNNQFQVIAATPEQVARLKPRLHLVQDGQYIVRVSPVCFSVLQNEITTLMGDSNSGHLQNVTFLSMSILINQRYSIQFSSSKQIIFVSKQYGLTGWVVSKIVHTFFSF